MVCRESSLSSAMVTFARDMTGLEDNQILGLNHALMQEGASVPGSQESWEEIVDQAIADFRSGQLTIAPGSHNPVRRLERARTENADGARMHAARNLLARARRARDAQVSYFQAYAREFGVPETHAATEFWVGFQDATEDSRLTASPAFQRAWLSNPDNTDLMVDRRSLYAYEQMEIARASRALQQESRPAVLAREPVDSSAIAEVGYDDTSGRLEVVMRTSPDRVYSYRMNSEEYAAFRSAPSLGSFFARNIRGNRNYAYGSAEESEAAATLHRCATCGQFASLSDHSCPITGSVEDVNRDIRLAVERARARAAGVQEPSQLPSTARLAPIRTARYLSELDGQPLSMRLPGASRITQEARRNAQVLVPVRAAIPGENGNTYEVQGYARVDYNGRGLGYSVSPVAEPGDSGTDNLRCTCPRYRATYHCEHIDAVVSRMDSLANGRDAASPQRVRAAAASVTDALTPGYEASLAATEAAERGWRPLSTSFTDNPAEFQTVYEDYRARWAAYKDALANGADPADLEYPVPYIRDNAFNGLADRGTPRSFGVELEFSFPPGTTEDERSAAIDAIGRELHSEGLTSSAYQRHYGASHGDYTEEHAGGWSFEEDGSTGTYPPYSGSNNGNYPIMGGEIVSPIMYDEEDTWNNLDKVCSILRKHGAIASTKSGSHVHVGVGDYDHRIENHNRFLASYASNEDLLYRMSSNPERGKHRGLHYCEPNDRPAAPYTTVGTVQRYQTGHHLALNMQSVSGRSSDHAEFRTFDASLNPAVIQAQIGMSVYMAEGALRPSSAQEDNPLGAQVRANPNRSRLTGPEWNESTKGMRRFLDSFVPGSAGDEKDNPRVRQMIALFSVTRWQRRNSS